MSGALLWYQRVPANDFLPFCCFQYFPPEYSRRGWRQEWRKLAGQCWTRRSLPSSKSACRTLPANKKSNPSKSECISPVCPWGALQQFAHQVQSWVEQTREELPGSKLVKPASKSWEIFSFYGQNGNLCDPLATPNCWEPFGSILQPVLFIK